MGCEVQIDNWIHLIQFLKIALKSLIPSLTAIKWPSYLAHLVQLHNRREIELKF